MTNIKELYDNVHQLVLPIETEFIIPEDDSVRLLSQVMEELDYTNLYKAYSTKGRNPAIQPKTLFKVLIYGYMNNIYSSRKLEEACKFNTKFLWLLQGQSAPDNATIARFRSKRLEGCMDDLFNQLVIKLGELNEIKYRNIFIDGTKIEANASKYSFVWKGSTTKFEAKLQEKIKNEIKNINTNLGTKFIIPKSKIEIIHIKSILNELNNIKDTENTEFVYGKGKRKSKLQKAIESLESFIEKQNKYDNYNNLFDGRNSFSKTDVDATFMHMKEDHMRNSQLKPGYNIQIGVEAEYIVGVDVSSERSDQLTFIPFLDKLDQSLPKRYKNIVADAGYESEENYIYLEKHAQNSFIKPQNYEGMKKSSFKNKIGKRENMQYNSESDFYICHNNKKLLPTSTFERTSKSGYKSTVTNYVCEDCTNCSVKNRCTKAKGNKQLQVSKTFIERRKNSLKNIIRPVGIILRMNRSIQVEGAFGVLKEDHGFRRFLMRGKKNIRIEFTLLALGYNINKLHSKIQQNRCGILLHVPKVI